MTPVLPEDLAALLRPDDPEWFVPELAVAAAPPWWIWPFALRNLGWLVSIFGRVEVTGSIPEVRSVRDRRRAVPRGDHAAIHGHRRHRLRTGGRATAGAVWGDPCRARHRADSARVRVTKVALVSGGHVVAFPEGRVGLAADAWPERGRTGMARLALGLGVSVVPVSHWSAHEVLQYANGWGKLRTAVRAVVRRPPLRVHVGAPVRLDDLRLGRIGDANRARYRIAAAITRGLVPLRPGEEARPRFVDPTPSDHRGRRRPRRRGSRKHPVTGRCWITAERPERVRR